MMKAASFTFPPTKPHSETAARLPRRRHALATRSQSLGVFAFLLFDHRLGKTLVGIDRLGDSGGDFTLALIEEGSASQPRL